MGSMWTCNCIFEHTYMCESVQVYYHLFICIAVGDPSSVEEGWDPINWFNSATFLCLSQAMTWISNVTHVMVFLCSVSSG